MKLLVIGAVLAVAVGVGCGARAETRVVNLNEVRNAFLGQGARLNTVLPPPGAPKLNYQVVWFDSGRIQVYILKPGRDAAEFKIQGFGFSKSFQRRNFANIAVAAVNSPHELEVMKGAMEILAKNLAKEPSHQT